MITERVSSLDGRRTTVMTDDGVGLMAYEYGSRAADLTVVLVHGHCMTAESWKFVRQHVSGAAPTSIRFVCYDLRGHGASGSSPIATYTIDQLGRDLAAVLQALAPIGPIVLIGHSMGAMTAMSYARQHSTSIGSRIVGVGLIATAASGIATLGLGRALRGPWVRLFRTVSVRTPGAMRMSRRLTRRGCRAIVRYAGFGTRRVPPTMVTFATSMLNDTEPATMAGFLAEFLLLDEVEALSLFDRVPTLVLGGGDDQMTPFAHSRAIADAIPSAELVCVHGAGHGVILERAPEVAAQVLRLLDRVQVHVDSLRLRPALVS